MNSYCRFRFHDVPLFDVIGTMHVIHVVIALFNEFPVVIGKKNLAFMEHVVSMTSGSIGDVMLWK